MPKRRLILVRHATAASSAGGTDHARGLTAKGREEAERVGRRLRLLDALPDHVLSSSALRCCETWAGIAKGLGTTPLVEFEDALYNAAPRELRTAISAVSDAESLLLLAHNPGISMFAFDLGGGEEVGASPLRAGFAPATLAIFEVEGPWSNVSRKTVHLLHMESPERD